MLLSGAPHGMPWATSCNSVLLWELGGRGATRRAAEWGARVECWLQVGWAQRSCAEVRLSGRLRGQWCRSGRPLCGNVVVLNADQAVAGGILLILGSHGCLMIGQVVCAPWCNAAGATLCT